MLPPSLRLVIRNPARSISLQLQRRLNSTDTGPYEFADFLSWARKSQATHRQKRSQSRFGHRNAYCGSSFKKREVKKTKRPDPPRLKLEKNPSNVCQTRERRISEAVGAVAGNEKLPSPGVSGWSGDNWKADNWHLDKLRPVSDGEDPIVQSESLESGSIGSKSRSNEHLRKGEMEYTRKLEGVLTPLGSPVLQDVDHLTKRRPIATLSHKLDRVLFNPGVHWLQEPRTGVYNFTPWLQSIPDVNDFAFERLPAFVKSSDDEDLWALAKREKKVFCGSTSSLTGLLSQVYFLISGIRRPDPSSLSRPFQKMPTDFTPSQRMPTSVVLNYEGGVYAIDPARCEKDDPDKSVLTWLGTLLEKFLTMPREEFRRLLRDSPNPAVDSGGVREAYRYAKSGRFVMRSQLDCHDPRLPGTGVFDLKTRAALPIRMDLWNYKQHSTYLLRTLQGELESFEREYHDLMRSAFLKYSFQARIGNMDGILVAHHNTARIFGFRYIPVSEMDACLFGGEDRGDATFEKCVLLLEEILGEVIRVFPSQAIRCLFETCGDKLNVFVEPEAHDESEGPRPIIHMVVQSTSYIDGDRTDGGSAVAKSGSWDLHWSIGHTSDSQEEKEKKLDGAKERQLRPSCLPPGVSIEEMEDIWNQLDYGNVRQLEETSEGPPGDSDYTSEEKESLFDPSHFYSPTKNIRLLRELSMKGKLDTELMLEKERGRPKLIWGELEAYTDQVELDGTPPGTEVVVEASEVAGEPLVLCEEVVLVDEDIRTNEATVPLVDCSETEEERGR